METEGFYMAEKRWRTWETVGLLVVLPRQYMHNKENAVTMRLSAH
jgi:hypothetical protein